MKAFINSLVAIVVVVCALLIAPAAQAQECAFPINTNSAHLLNGYFTGVPEAYLSGRVWVMGSDRNNDGIADFDNGSAVFFCGASDAGQFAAGGNCQPEAGTSTDGQVTIQGNWAAAGVTGCPLSLAAGNLADGQFPNVAIVTSITGEGTA